MEKLEDKIRVISSEPAAAQQQQQLQGIDPQPKVGGGIVLALNVGPLLRIWGRLTGSSSLAPSLWTKRWWAG